MSFLPPEASTYAPRVDAIYFGLLLFSSFTVLLVLGLIVGFSFKYRNGSPAFRGPLPEKVSREIEIGWTLATLFAFVFCFFWAGSTFVTQLTPPKNGLEIHVVAKQWMWKTQHPNGAREINALHVPTGVPVKLIMTSQDVIHSFYVPAFRIKQDVLPGRYVQSWFTAKEPGTYHLFCAEYCGTDHARMTGEVTAMTPGDYARWSQAQPQGDDLAHQGAAVFQSLGCAGCHASSNAVHAPDLVGVYGSQVPLEGGGFKLADEAYIRDSIMLPRKDVVAGFQPIMPSYQGIVSEDELIPLIAYIKSLRRPGGPPP